MFTLTGTTRPFKGDGRKLGFPTANIDIPTDTPEGQFVGHVEFNGKTYGAIIFIGAPVTMGDTIKRAEAHLLDFADQDLYGIEMTFHIEHKMRDNRLFKTKELLIKQLQKDEQNAREYLGL